MQNDRLTRGKQLSSDIYDLYSVLPQEIAPNLNQVGIASPGRNAAHLPVSRRKL